MFDPVQILDHALFAPRSVVVSNEKDPGLARPGQHTLLLWYTSGAHIHCNPLNMKVVAENIQFATRWLAYVLPLFKP